MAIAEMQPAKAVTSERKKPVDRSVDEIIDAARAAGPPVRGALLLSLMTAIPLWAAFTPLDLGPLAWVALVPLVMLVRMPQPSRRMYPVVYLGGLVFWLVTLQWMRLGDVWMYPAWLALAAYVALYFPLFVGLSRVAVHRWGAPLTLAVPVVWVGLEFLRAHVLGGFSWYYLGHTQHQWNQLIQISDLFGAYGVSFLVAMGNAVLAGLMPFSVLGRLKLLPLDRPDAASAAESRDRRAWWPIAALLIVMTLAVSYGFVRRGQAQFDAGPRVALIQGNFPSSLKHDPNAWQEMYQTHMQLTMRAVLEQPDVVIWPETMFTWPLLELEDGMTEAEFLKQYAEMKNLIEIDEEARLGLMDIMENSGASVIIGLEAFQVGPDKLRRFNSAQFIDRQVGIAGRYDKLHRVPFGEYVPGSDQFPSLQRALSFTGPIPISAGERVHVFNTESYRFVPLICFEDTVPHLVRNMVSSSEAKGKDVDCLVNLTNDGWFHGSSELDQHLITATFRCVETRTPMVRAVNTGISAIIDGDGVVREPDVFVEPGRGGQQEIIRSSMRDPETGRYYKQVNAALIGNVPLDNRQSPYVRWGDWFASLCAAVCLLLLVTARRRGSVKPATAADS